MAQSAPSAAELAELVQGGFEIRAAKAIVLVGLMVLYYDYFLTFDDEVRFIWKKPKSFVSWMLFFNRYYVLVSYSMAILYFFPPDWWTKKFNLSLIDSEQNSCIHGARFLPIGLTLILLISSSTLLTLRVYALYNQNKFLLAFLVTYIIAQFGVGLWIYSSPQPGPFTGLSPHGGEFYFCAPQNPPELAAAAAAYNTMETVFEFIIFFLVLTRTRSLHKATLGVNGIVATLLNDGAIYFLFIGSSQLAWTLMLYTAPHDIQNILSGLTIALVTVMINRITMNLRAKVAEPGDHLGVSKEVTGADIGMYNVGPVLTEEEQEETVIGSHTGTGGSRTGQSGEDNVIPSGSGHRTWYRDRNTDA